MMGDLEEIRIAPYAVPKIGVKLEESGSSTTKVETYKCVECNRHYATKKAMNSHKASHKIKRYKCSHCPEAFRLQSFLKKHLKEHVEIQCKYCEKSFFSPTLLEKHEEDHKKLFIRCNYCEEKFENSENLNSHLNIHSNGKPFKCSYCMIFFSCDKKCAKHVKTHFEKRFFYDCCFCMERLTTRTKLIRHLRLHTGEKPYKCDFCPASFSTYSVWENHRNSHVKTWNCKQCEAKYEDEFILYNHKMIRAWMLARMWEPIAMSRQ